MQPVTLDRLKYISIYRGYTTILSTSSSISSIVAFLNRSSSFSLVSISCRRSFMFCVLEVRSVNSNIFFLFWSRFFSSSSCFVLYIWSVSTPSISLSTRNFIFLSMSSCSRSSFSISFVPSWLFSDFESSFIIFSMIFFLFFWYWLLQISSKTA